MKARGMIFNGDMVRAIIDGRKTVTRRPVKGQGEEDNPIYTIRFEEEIGMYHVRSISDMSVSYEGCDGLMHSYISCPFGVVGDRIWVRETWAEGQSYGGDYPIVMYKSTMDGFIGYKERPVREVNSDNYASVPNGIKWTPSIHMPRWASRITLEITSVSVERVQDITEDDAVCEGFRYTSWPDYFGGSESRFALGNFAETWESIYPGSWHRNDWVWRMEFKVVEC